ncbi:hypothetical protein LIER_38410 [Lithospermum erythrorhizon]|uniref:Uncharacterized protein n=1 Tax=Lithospermum erythrorhizon TaxID=34254 RepID=A0AAV3Q4M4_LITER
MPVVKMSGNTEGTTMLNRFNALNSLENPRQSADVLLVVGENELLLEQSEQQNKQPGTPRKVSSPSRADLVEENTEMEGLENKTTTKLVPSINLSWQQSEVQHLGVSVKDLDITGEQLYSKVRDKTNGLRGQEHPFDDKGE